MAEWKSIAIVRLSSLGDIVHTLPAFSLLRRRFPGARIDWLAEAAGARLLKNFSGIDTIVPLAMKGKKWRDVAVTLFRFIRRNRHRYEAVIDFQGLFKSAILAFLLDGERFGFHAANTREKWASYLYGHRAPPFDEADHVIRKNIHLACALGVEADAIGAAGPIVYPRVAVPPSSALTDLWQALKLQPKDFFLLNVGGGWPTKVLSAEQYSQIARALRNRRQLIVLWGSEAERRTAEVVCAASGAVAAPLPEFNDLIAWIARSRLLVSGDTLALHLADLVGTPSVGVFGPTSPRRNGSLLPASRAVVTAEECRFCYRRKCDTMSCLRHLDMSAVIHACQEIDEKLE